jgi:hypothetical protein
MNYKSSCDLSSRDKLIRALLWREANQALGRVLSGGGGEGWISDQMLEWGRVGNTNNSDLKTSQLSWAALTKTTNCFRINSRV